MNKKEKKELKEEIIETKKLNREEVYLMMKYGVNAYMNSLFVFGPNSDCTKESLNLLTKFINIIKKESNIHKNMLKNYLLINLSESLEIMDSLDELNTKTVEYFYDAIDDILDACLTKEEIRAKHRRKNFDMLIETNEYDMQVAGLSLNFSDIKEYLNYPQDFWNYVMPKVTQIDSHYEEAGFFYNVLMKFDDENNLKDIRVFVPHIINLRTALVNVHEFKHAYDLYNLLGKKLEDDMVYEDRAISEEDKFTKQYVMNKLKK